MYYLSFSTHAHTHTYARMHAHTPQSWCQRNSSGSYDEEQQTIRPGTTDRLRPHSPSDIESTVKPVYVYMAVTWPIHSVALSNMRMYHNIVTTGWIGKNFQFHIKRLVGRYKKYPLEARLCLWNLLPDNYSEHQTLSISHCALLMLCTFSLFPVQLHPWGQSEDSRSGVTHWTAQKVLHHCWETQVSIY